MTTDLLRKLAFIMLALAVGCALSWAWLERHYRLYYESAEPYFALPVLSVQPGKAQLRSDAFGKGHYGASRSNNRTHQGLDFATPLGMPIMASKSGRVLRAQDDPGGYGLFVEILHVDGLMTRYAHLSRMDVRAGDWVRMGQTVGLCGRTGNADSPRILPHVHFEIRNPNGSLNPSQPGLLDPAVQLIP